MTADPQFDIAYGPHPRQRLDVYPAKSPSRQKTAIIFWHGGSWRSGDKRTYRFVGRTLARMGLTAVIPNYRLFPEVRFPEFIKDAARAAAWVHETLPDHQVILMGHSAGALIAADLALDSHYLDAETAAAVRGWIGLAGPYDFVPHPSLRPVFAGTAPTDWLPINLVGRPRYPALLVQGRLDRVVEPRNATVLGAAINWAGGHATTRLYRQLEHFGAVLPLFPGLGWLAPIRRDIRRFITALN